MLVQRWEYRTMVAFTTEDGAWVVAFLNSEGIQSRAMMPLPLVLDQFGNEGWELVSTLGRGTADDGLLIFRRLRLG